ncbi:MAG: YtxH domain-containing protein [Bacteroidales bacterium]|nr:YtxH domain-containing protein [Bacteroidales bacterium]
MRTSSFFALLTGLAAGAVLGVLFAPESGEKCRKRIKRAAEDCLDAAKEKAEEIASEIEAEVKKATSAKENE